MSETKICKVCGEARPIKVFRISTSGYRIGKCNKCRGTDHQRYCDRYPERRRRIQKNSRLKKSFGITLDQYDGMFSTQGGKCAICSTDTPDAWHKHFSVDHCHKTGRIRGLLCTNCNNGLGRFHDDPAILSRAIYYLTET